MRKVLKVSGIIIVSVLGLFLIVFGLISWLLLSRSGLEKTARYAIEHYSPCRVDIGDINMSFFHSFPRLSLEVNNIVIYNQLETAPSDTLASIDRAYIGLNFEALRKQHLAIIESVSIKKSRVMVFTDNYGNSVLDIFSDTVATVQPEKEAFSLNGSDSANIGLSFRIDYVGLEQTDVYYTDLSQSINAVVNNICIDMDGRIDSTLRGNVNVMMRMGSIIASLGDSVMAKFCVNDIKLKSTCNLNNPRYMIDGNVTFNGTALCYGDIAANLNNIAIDFTSATDLNDRCLDVDAEFSTSGINADVDGLDINFDKTGANLNVRTSLDFQTAELTMSAMTRAIEFLMRIDDTTSVSANINKIGLDCFADIDIDALEGSAQMNVIGDGICINMTGVGPVACKVPSISLNMTAGKIENQLDFTPTVSSPSVTIKYDGETYVDGLPIKFSVPMSCDTQLSYFNVSNALLSLNNQSIGLDAKCRIQDVKGIDASTVLRLNKIDIKTVMNMIPEGLHYLVEDIQADGFINAILTADANINDTIYTIHFADASVYANNLSVSYNDTIMASSDQIQLSAFYPGEMSTAVNQTIDLHLKSGRFAAEMNGDVPIKAKLSDIQFSGYASGLMNGIDNLEALLFVNSKNVDATFDTIYAKIGGLDLSAYIGMSANSASKPKFHLNLGCDTLTTVMGSMLTSRIGKTELYGEVQIDNSKEDILLRYSPILTVLMNNASVDDIGLPIEMPKLDLDFNLDKFVLNNSRITVGKSDVNLTGHIENLRSWLNNTGLLTGHMDFVSDHTDMTELMSLVSGFGVDQDSLNTTVESFATTDTAVVHDTVLANPFIVPLGVDITLNTHIKEMEFNNHLFNNLGGDITIKDGALILQELGFSSNAAEMQLTAIYKTPEPDNLYMGLDFHLLDIEISELIDLIPSVDTIVPMLKSFDGKAQFHLAAETELDQYYNLRMPTLIGAAAIEGKDLIVMDNDVFNGIKRKLLMSKKAENKIDSLSVEMQVLRNKVDLYPFLVHMDRYSAVIGGRHNINPDLSCRYHISLTECPLPIRLGVTVSGPINGIAEKPLKHIKLARCEYKKYFKPEKAGVTEARTAAMKQDILNTLRSNVRK